MCRKLCEYYGEIFLSAWKSAEPDENRRNVELIFEDVVRYAITTDLNTSESFRSVSITNFFVISYADMLC